MAIRPVFIESSKPPYFKMVNIEFKWNGGFAKCQSQKNINAIHTAFLSNHPDYGILEISSKSTEEIGTKLSAFSLLKYVPSINKSIPVECIYQGSKVFSNGGPYTDLYLKSPKEAKTDGRLKSSGELTGFHFESIDYPLGNDFTFMIIFIFLLSMKILFLREK